MAEIEYWVNSVRYEKPRFRISSNTSWLGDLVISESDFHRIGKPTAGDVIILNIFSYKEWMNRSCKESARKEVNG